MPNPDCTIILLDVPTLVPSHCYYENQLKSNVLMVFQCAYNRAGTAVRLSHQLRERR